MNRSSLKSRGTALVTGLFLFFAASWAGAEPKVVGIGAIGMTVSDMDRSVAFFSKVLTFAEATRTEFHKEPFDRLTGLFGARVRIVTMKLGRETIELTQYLTPEGRAVPADSRSNDLWFEHIAIVVRDMDAAYERLQQFNVKPISTEPQRIPDWNKAAAGVRAYYFRDPDNHPLELIYFPPGKGDPRWQAKTGALFLGIDHTAIAVSDTEKSLRFYRDLLGLRVAGESLNYGIEQERLNHVFGSRVRITGLRAPEGPGIEFLEYVVPSGGRAYPEDARPNDVFHWQTTLRIGESTETFNRLMSEQTRFISPEVVQVQSWDPGGKKAMLIRDPDGHALKLVEP